MKTASGNFHREVAMFMFYVFASICAFISWWAGLFVGAFDNVLRLVPFHFVGAIHPIYCIYALLMGYIMIGVLDASPMLRRTEARSAYAGAGLGVFIGQLVFSGMMIGFVPALIAAISSCVAYVIPLGVTLLIRQRSLRVISLAA